MSEFHWRTYFREAEIETDSEHLGEKVSLAKMAIVDRYRELADSAASEDERRSLSDAARVLRKIEVEQLDYPLVRDHWGHPIC